MNWIDLNDSLPAHQKTVLVKCKTKDNKIGFVVAVFIDAKKMNETLMHTEYANECVDTKKNPYYFVSQEIKQNTVNGATHWMELTNW